MCRSDKHFISCEPRRGGSLPERVHDERAGCIRLDNATTQTEDGGPTPRLTMLADNADIGDKADHRVRSAERPLFPILRRWLSRESSLLSFYECPLNTHYPPS
jgi:hypothetical protein